ncbi:MAG: bacteriohemerythrin [Coriobacteriales bacterium]|nr:bacteriohemerythrin [Coriobacteriales bacterium]
MTPFEWDPTLETGDLVVDRQHMTIHRLFNQLECAADNPAEIMRVLDYLSEYVLMHFATEEDLMAREGFPEAAIDSHMAEHRKLTEGVRVKVLEFRRGELTSTAPVLEFLRDWLKTHVHECDRELVVHVRGRGAYARVPEPWASCPPKL